MSLSRGQSIFLSYISHLSERLDSYRTPQHNLKQWETQNMLTRRREYRPMFVPRLTVSMNRRMFLTFTPATRALVGPLPS